MGDRSLRTRAAAASGHGLAAGGRGVPRRGRVLRGASPALQRSPPPGPRPAVPAGDAPRPVGHGLPLCRCVRPPFKTKLGESTVHPLLNTPPKSTDWDDAKKKKKHLVRRNFGRGFFFEFDLISMYALCIKWRLHHLIFLGTRETKFLAFSLSLICIVGFHLFEQELIIYIFRVNVAWHEM